MKYNQKRFLNVLFALFVTIKTRQTNALQESAKGEPFWNALHLEIREITEEDLLALSKAAEGLANAIEHMHLGQNQKSWE